MTLSRRTYALTLFLILLICYGYFMPKWADWGANSRADLVYAVGDHGVLYIDDYHQNTGDKACYPGPYDLASDTCTGHYYTDKSIGPSLIALPFYLVFKGIAALPPVERFIASGRGLGALGDTLNPEGQGIRPNAMYEAMALTFITFFATSIPSALLGVIVFLMACRLTGKDEYAFITALVYGLATIAFPYSNVLYQHQLAAFGMFVSFYLLWRVIYEAANVRWLWVVGVLMGLAVITEYPVVPALAILFIWAAVKLPNRLALYRVVLGAIPPGLIFAAYNYAIFSTPLPVGYEYSTLWQDVHQVGFLSLSIPRLDTFLGLTISPFRGLFFLSPALLLAIPGFAAALERYPKYRSGLVSAIGVVIFFFLYNSSSVMWWGGHTVGPRYLAPMVPFLALPLATALDRLMTRRLTRVIVFILIALSFANVWIQSISGQSFPPAVLNDGTQITNPLFQYSLPLFAEGHIARNYGTLFGLPGFLSLIPLAVALALVALIVPRAMRGRESALESRPARTRPATGRGG